MRIITGVQPSGTITIGNYFGSIKNFESIIDGNDSLIFIADQHALTVNPKKLELKENIKRLVALYIAFGFDKKSNIFIQSQVAEHSQLAWTLQCHTKMGELERMTQFKDKSNKQNSISLGLFTYPTLMAADILLYQADAVPVGEDQKQHLELTKTLGLRMNHFYKNELFKIPEPIIQKTTSKIYSLTEPTKKMSKSDPNPKSFISVLDEPKVIEKKIKSAVTDSIGIINYDKENQPGVANLLNIYCACSNKTMNEALLHFENQNYGFLKSEVAKELINELLPIQEKYAEIYDNKEKISEVLISGQNYAQKIARKTISKVNKNNGFYQM